MPHGNDDLYERKIKELKDQLENKDKTEGQFDILIATLFFQIKFMGLLTEIALFASQSEFDPKKEEKRVEYNNELAELEQQRNIFMNEVSDIMGKEQAKRRKANANKN